MVHCCVNCELVDQFTCGSSGVAVELEFCPSAAMAGELHVAAQLTCRSMVGETENGSPNVVVCLITLSTHKNKKENVCHMRDVAFCAPHVAFLSCQALSTELCALDQR